jgi:[NiFe] hydrogenase diaphorase moiety large subunit
VGTVLIRNKLRDLLQDRGSPADLAYLQALGATLKLTSRCGLGQTAANPAVTSIKSFPAAYQARMKRPKKDEAFLPAFDIQAALGASRAITGRDSVVFKA